MKTTTRLLALLLALCMVFAFAACGKDPSDPTDPTDPSNPTTPTLLKPTYISFFL